MRLNIFDNGLQGRTGHHFDIGRNVAAGFRARGWEVRVHGAVQSDPAVADELARVGCTYVPLFSHFAYTPLDLGNAVRSGVDKLAQRAADELGQAAQADLNLFPSLKPLEFYALSRSNLGGASVGYVHAEPFHQGPFAAEVWRLAATRARQRGLPVKLGAIDPLIADFLAGYLDGQAVETFPIALGGPGKTQYAERAATIGFFGSQREERGMNLIAPLAGQLLALGYGIVLHDTQGQFTNTNGHPGLRVVGAFVDDLQAEMLGCDIVVCTMQRENYMHRLSGVACNAMAAGLPFVLPAGTLSAARFAAHGSCRTYLEQSPAGIVQAVQELAQDYARYAEAARRAAQHWRTLHGVEHFIDKVLARLPQASHASPNPIPNQLI